MKPLLLRQKRGMKFSPIVSLKMNVKKQRNLFDRFFAAGILRGTDMIGQTYI